MSNSLAAVHPELIAEWSEKNLPLTPDSITFGSNKKVWWKGACGHEWETSIKARSSGEKCPICSGARVVAGINDLSTLKPELASEWSEENEIKPTEVSIGSHKKVIWKCKLGHEWIATVKSRTINRTGCPYCSHNKVLAGFNDLATLFPEVANEWSDKNEKKPTEVMAFANSKAWWKCRTCGYEWNTLISTRSGGSKCPCCSGYTFIKGKNDLKSTHPQIAEEWSEKNFPLKPNEVNAKSRKNVWWHCRKCGNEWKSVINARVKGTVCPVCAEREVLAGYNDLATTDRELLVEWDYELNKFMAIMQSQRRCSMREQNETFNYTYSAEQQKEIETIRKKYIADTNNNEVNKLEQLRRLDYGVTKKATIISLSVGILSILVMGSGMSLVMTDLGEKIGIAGTSLIGVLIGIVGMIGVILAYPLYRRIIEKERKKIAPQILKLTDELSQK